MTSETPFTNGSCLQDIDVDGFIFLSDSAVGIRAEEFASNGYPCNTVKGLNFLQAIMNDAVSMVYSISIVLF